MMRIGSKKKSKKNGNKADLRVMLIIFILFAAAMAGFAWFQTSGKVFSEFDSTCQHFGYNDCMRFYWYQLDYYKKVMYTFSGLAVLAIIALAVSQTRTLLAKRK